MIENWYFYIRLLTIGAALLLIAQIAAGEMRHAIRLPLILALTGAIAGLTSAVPAGSSHSITDALIDLFALSMPFWTWLFARHLFEREAPHRVVLIAAAVLVAAWSIGNVIAPAALIGFYVIQLVSLGLVADIARVALTGRADDPVEPRRIIRLWLPVLVTAQSGTMVLGGLIAAPDAAPPALQLVSAVMMFVLVLFLGLSLFRTDPGFRADRD